MMLPGARINARALLYHKSPVFPSASSSALARRCLSGSSSSLKSSSLPTPPQPHRPQVSSSTAAAAAAASMLAAAIAAGLAVGGGVCGDSLCIPHTKRVALTEALPVSETTRRPEEDANLAAPDAGVGRRVGRPAPRKSSSGRYYPYVILGSGTTALAALEALRQQDPSAPVLLVVNEHKVPRPDSRSQEDNGATSELSGVYNEWRRHLQSRLDYVMDSNPPAVLRCKPTALRIDAEGKRIKVADGSKYRYGACLVATTGKPNAFYVLDSAKMSYSLQGSMNALRDLSEFHELEMVAKMPGRKHITVVGGGFLGTELVLALTQIGRDQAERSGGADKLEITHMFVEENPLYRYVPEYLSQYIGDKMRAEGVVTSPQRVVTSVEPLSDNNNDGDIDNSDTDGGRVGNAGSVGRSSLKRADSISGGKAQERRVARVKVNVMGREKESMTTNYVVLASTHVAPDIRAVAQSGLELDAVNGGVVTNSAFEAYNGLFAAGTAGSFYDPVLGRRRVHSYDHAVNSGLCAGRNMAALVRASDGDQILRYRHQPVFRGSLPGAGLVLEGIGTVDARLKTVGVWLTRRQGTEQAGSHGEGDSTDTGSSRANVVVGILCCNATECLGMAREVLKQQTVVADPVALKRRIPLAPEDWLNVIVTNEK